MTTSILILSVLAVSLFFVALRRGDESHKKGIVIGAKLFWSYIPLLLLAFLIAGLIQVVLPADLVRSWLGEEAGWRGIVIGSFTGFLVAAGPYVAFPIFASILHSGAGIGTAVALITSWSLMNLAKLPFEVALLGPRFSLARISLILIMPVIAGFLAQLFFPGIL